MKRSMLLMLVVGIAFSLLLVGCAKKKDAEKPVEEKVTEKKVEAPKEVEVLKEVEPFKKIEVPKETEEAKPKAE